MEQIAYSQISPIPFHQAAKFYISYDNSWLHNWQCLLHYSVYCYITDVKALANDLRNPPPPDCFHFSVWKLRSLQTFSLVYQFDRALDGGERDGAKVATGLPELYVLGAELFLAELLEVVATGHVVEEV